MSLYRAYISEMDKVARRAAVILSQYKPDEHFHIMKLTTNLSKLKYYHFFYDKTRFLTKVFFIKLSKRLGKSGLVMIFIFWIHEIVRLIRLLMQ
jgi:hypothetical protein